MAVTQPQYVALPPETFVSAESRGHSGGDRLKRAFDLAVSLSLLIVLMPLFCLLAAAVKLESRGPVFYPARRVGRYGREFAMLKFRKMHHDATGSPLTGAGDARFTRLGRVLSRTRLDEMPQLINVIRGEMSLVGPRPEDPSFVELEPERFAEVLRVRPGLTGYSQLAFADEVKLLETVDPIVYYVERLLPAKAQLDALYARRRTLVTDVRVLAWTTVVVVGRRQVAVWRDTGRIGLRRRPADAPAPAPAPSTACSAVIFVGDVGAQLAPEIGTVPLPPPRIGGRLPLEIALEQVRAHGIEDLSVSVGPGDYPLPVGSEEGEDAAAVRILREEESCTEVLRRLTQETSSSLLIVNGDVLTSIDYTALIDHHRRNGNALTIAGHLRRTRVDFGVLRWDPHSSGGQRLTGYDGECDVDVTVNPGIYVVEPAALRDLGVRDGSAFPDIIDALLATERPVGVYPYAGFWLDVRRQDDYEAALATFGSLVDPDESVALGAAEATAPSV